MEHLVQLHIKIFFIALLLLAGCSNNKQTVIWNSTDFNSSKGIMYYHNMPYTGKLIELYDNKDTACISEYAKGKQEGKEICYHKNGRLKSERYYSDGMKEGEHFGWWENGNPMFVHNYKEDVFDGNQKEWNEKGTLFKDFNYEMGYENGSQKLWYSDGTLQANYVVKENRKYGLTGKMNCVSRVNDK